MKKKQSKKSSKTLQMGNGYTLEIPEDLVRPIDYWLEPEQLVQIKNWCIWGESEENIANRMGITLETLKEWRRESLQLDNALRNTMGVVDSFVEESLLEKALDGDLNAIKYWLGNRRSEQWNSRKLSPAQERSIELDNELKQQKLDEALSKQIASETHAFNGIPADLIAPLFMKAHHAIQRRDYTTYIFPGGRGSTKSSYVSLEIINLIETHPNVHACVTRMVADTLRRSVYTQIQWAIDKLGLTDEYSYKQVPLEITKKSTGQKIYFYGCDDPGKLKSIQVPFGHMSVLWFEELDQFKGSEFMRKVEQSVIRGSDEAWIFKSYNPPRSKNNWCNEYTEEARLYDDKCLVTDSTYLDVPKDWLGQPFIDQAEYLKETRPHAYENEYLGIANGSGGNVFENVVPRAITDEEIRAFDHVSNGVDFGWFPDPWQFVRVNYEPAQSRLYIFDSVRKIKTPNTDTAEIVKQHLDSDDEYVICDSAEPKSITDYCNAGLRARGAIKGRDSVDYGIKWLASLNEIVIDPDRCPEVLREFLDYEFDRDENNEILNQYPDINNHSIDAVRYATERFSRRQNKIEVVEQRAR